MENSPESAVRLPRARSHIWLTLAAGLAALAAYFANRVLLERPDLPARLPIALAPLPFFVLFLAPFVRLVRGRDEFERRSGVALSPADWSYRHVWPIGVVLHVGGMALASRRYGFR